MDLLLYGLQRFIDVAASVMLRFGIRSLDRLMDRGFASVGGQESGARLGVVVVPIEDVGESEPGAMAGAVAVVGAGSVGGTGSVAVAGAGSVDGAEVGDQLPGCDDCVVEMLDSSEVTLVCPQAE